jgi:hypothetical protein
MKKKNKITLVSITSIIIIVSFSYYFIDFPSENKGEIVGSWEILMKYTGPDYMRWVNIWTFNENGTLYYYQGYPYDTSINIRIPQIYFHQNMTSNELTVVEADNYRPSGNVYTREKGNWSINGGKICIYLLNISECAKYSLSKNSLVIYLYNGLILEKTTEPEYDESLENNLLEWNDLEIIGSCDKNGLSGKIMEGQKITNCTGLIQIKYLSNDRIISSCLFYG